MKLGRNLRARALWIPILLAGWSLPGHLLAQARATFKLGEVTAAPGATEVSLPISIEVPPETGFVEAWALAVKYDPAVLAGVVITSTRQTDAFTFVPDGGYAEPGTVTAELYYTVDAWNSPSPGVNSEDDGVIAELRFCVPPSASPGVYPVEFASATAAQCPRATFATWYVAGGQGDFTPPVQGGTVTIGGPSLPGGGGPPGKGATLPPAPAGLRGAFQVGGVTVPPGGTRRSFAISIRGAP